MKTTLKKAKGLFVAVLIVATAVCSAALLFGCKKNPEPQPEPPVPTVTLSQSNARLDIYDEILLTATKTDTDENIAWSSENDAVVTVDNGLVKAQGVGTTKVSASAGGVSATCEIEVYDSFTAPVMLLNEKSIEIGMNGGEYTAEARVMWKGKELTDQITAFDWELDEETPDDLVSLTYDGKRAVFVGGSERGNTMATVSATVRGIEQPIADEIEIYVHNLNITFAFEDDGDFEPQSNGKYATRVSMLATDKGDKAEIGVLDSLTVYERESGSGTFNKVSDPDLTFDYSGDTIVIENDTVKGLRNTENGDPVSVTVKYKDSDGLTFTVDVYRPYVELTQKEVPFIENTKAGETYAFSDLTDDTIDGEIEDVTIEGVSVTTKEFSESFTIDQSKLPKNTDSLGMGKSLGIDTSLAHYTLKADLITLKIMNETDFADMFTTHMKAAEEKAYLWGGYFVLGNNIDYTGKSFQNLNIMTYDKMQAAFTSEGVSLNWTDGSVCGFRGTFDGNGHYVKGAVEYWTDSALFGILNKDGVIKNTAFINGGTMWGGSYLVHAGSGTVENVYVQTTLRNGSSNNVYGTVFGKTADRNARVNRVFIDVTHASATPSYSYAIGNMPLGYGVLNDVYVIGCSVENAVNTSETTGAGTDVYGAYYNYTELADAEIDFDDWASLPDKGFWKLYNGYPYPACLEDPSSGSTDISLPSVTDRENIELVIGKDDIVSVSATNTGVSLNITGKTAAAIVIDDATPYGTEITVSVKNAFSSDAATTKTIRVVSIDSVDVSSENLLDVDYSVSGASTVDLTSAFADNDKLKTYDFASMTLESAILSDGNAATGATLESGTLTFSADAKSALRASKAYGEKEVDLVLSSGTQYLSVKAKITFASVVITQKEQMARDTFMGYADILPNVTSAQGIVGTATKLLQGYYVLGADVDVTGMKVGFTPGQSGGFVKTALTDGGFDGRGHVIKGYTSTEEGGLLSGGFFSGAWKSTVKNVTFLDAEMKSTGGLLVSAMNNCTIENVAVYCKSFTRINDDWYPTAGNNGCSLLVGIADSVNTIKNVLVVMADREPLSSSNWNSRNRIGGMIVAAKQGNGLSVENAIAINLKGSYGADAYKYGLPAIGDKNYDPWDLDHQNGGFEKVKTYHGWEDYVAKANTDGSDKYFDNNGFFGTVEFGGSICPVASNTNKEGEYSSARYYVALS